MRDAMKVLAAAAALAVVSVASAEGADPEPPARGRVRELKVEHVPFELRGGGGAQVFARPTLAAELGGRVVSDGWRKERDALAGKVDARRESLVFVRYSTSGPPYGELKYRLSRGKREVEFYCQEPKGDRGEKGKAGAAFFAAPKGFEVKWGGNRE
jgi:hypothetical protein